VVETVGADKLGSRVRVAVYCPGQKGGSRVQGTGRLSKLQAIEREAPARTL
jgi:hypothetical protein